MRHMNPPKRPPELHDEPEPEYQPQRMSDVYRAVGTGILVVFILLAVGVFLGVIWDQGTREPPVRTGMRIEVTK